MEQSARKLTIGVELEPGSQPISGTLSAEAGEPTAFSGWIELVASLREAIAEANPPGSSEEAGGDARQDKKDGRLT